MIHVTSYMARSPSKLLPPKSLSLHQVFVHNNLCGTVKYTAGQSVYVVECGDITGSAIKITQEGTLTLCEVEVLGRLF